APRELTLRTLHPRAGLAPCADLPAHGGALRGRTRTWGKGTMTNTDYGASALPDLTQAETLRYSRHLIMPEVGPEGQRKLKAARVLLVGAGGLGSPSALYLAAAGVGTLGLVDFDVVDESNLQRQVLYGTKDLGRPKLEAASERIRDVNPNVRVVQHPE